MVTVTLTWERLDGKPTIYTELRDKLGREPTSKECEEEVKRILREARVNK